MYKRQTYTWTVRVPNTGNAATNNLIVTETLGAGWEGIAAVKGSLASAIFTITEGAGGSTIVWNIGRLALGTTWTATFSAKAEDLGTDYRNTLTAHTQCATAGCGQSVAVPTYSSPLQDFNKTISQTPVSIGEPFSFTLTADLYGSRTYTSTYLTDTLPTLAGTLVFSYTSVVIGSENQATNGWTFSNTNPKLLVFRPAAGAVTGNAQGPDRVVITVTGIISNEVAANNNDIFTNRMDLTYRDDGQRYGYSDNVTGTIKEPYLVITKQASPTSNIKAGDEVTYTLFLTHTGASTATAYDVVLVDAIPDVFTYKATSLVATGAASTFTADQVVSATYASLPLGSGVTITYVVIVDAGAEPSSLLTNTVSVTDTSTLGANPNERTGSGVGPNDYTTGTSATVSTADVRIAKSLVDDRDYTIGEAITYTVVVSLPTGTTRNVVITDTIPAGLRFITPTSFISLAAPFVLPSYGFAQNPALGGDGSGQSSATITFNSPVNNTTPGMAPITWTLRLIVADMATANHGETKVNTATVSYVDADNNTEIKSADVPVDIAEPLLIIEKSVSPVNALRGSTLFYTIKIYHAATSTVPAYNVLITDVLPADLSYISNSWANYAGPAADAPPLDDTDLPNLTGGWSMIPPSVTVTNPIELRFNAVIPVDATPPAPYENVITTTWTSLATDPYGETRDGGGGVDDYTASDNALAAVVENSIRKTGPITATAGSVITYVVSVFNSGPFTSTGAVVSDVMPFQVDALSAIFNVPGGTNGNCTITQATSGDLVGCTLGLLPPGATAKITVTAKIDAATPIGADLSNKATLSLTSFDSDYTDNTVIFETEIDTRADLEVNKTGPATAIAGEQITYTIVLTNNGPSYATNVDVKDLLPPGVTFDSGTSSQGLCVNAICQLNEVAPGTPITMVVTGTVGSDVTGLVTNKAQGFSATVDDLSLIHI